MRAGHFLIALFFFSLFSIKTFATESVTTAPESSTSSENSVKLEGWNDVLYLWNRRMRLDLSGCKIRGVETFREDILRCIREKYGKIPPQPKIAERRKFVEWDEDVTRPWIEQRHMRAFFEPKAVLPHNASVEFGAIHTEFPFRGQFTIGVIMTQRLIRTLEQVLSNRLGEPAYLDQINQLICSRRNPDDTCQIGGGGGGGSAPTCTASVCWQCPGGGLDCVANCSFDFTLCDTDNANCAEQTLDNWCFYIDQPIDINISLCYNRNDVDNDGVADCNTYDSDCDNDALYVTIGVRRVALEAYLDINACPGSQCAIHTGSCLICDNYNRLYGYTVDDPGDPDPYGLFLEAAAWPLYCLHTNWNDCSEWHDCQDRSKINMCACVSAMYLDSVIFSGCDLPVVGDITLCLPTYTNCNPPGCNPDCDPSCTCTVDCSCNCSCSITDLGCCVRQILCEILDAINLEGTVMGVLVGAIDSQLNNFLADLAAFNTDLLCIFGEEAGSPCGTGTVDSAAVAAYPQLCGAQTLNSAWPERDSIIFAMEAALSQFTPNACIETDGSDISQAESVGVSDCGQNPSGCFRDPSLYDVGIWVGEEILNELWYWLFVSGMMCNACVEMPPDFARIVLPPVQRVTGWPFPVSACLVPYVTQTFKPYVDVTGPDRIALGIPRMILRFLRATDRTPLAEVVFSAYLEGSFAWLSNCGGPSGCHPYDPYCNACPSPGTCYNAPPGGGCKYFACEVCDNAGCPRTVYCTFPAGCMELTLQNIAFDVIDARSLNPAIPTPPTFSYTDIADIVGTLLETKGQGIAPYGRVRTRPYLAFFGVAINPVRVDIVETSGTGQHGALVLELALTEECMNLFDLLIAANQAPAFDGVTGSAPEFQYVVTPPGYPLNSWLVQTLVDLDGGKFEVKSEGRFRYILLDEPREIVIKAKPASLVSANGAKPKVFWKIEGKHGFWRISDDGVIKVNPPRKGEKQTVLVMGAYEIYAEGDEDSSVFINSIYPAVITIEVKPRFSFRKIERRKWRVSSPDLREFEVSWKVDDGPWSHAKATAGFYDIEVKGKGKVLWVRVKDGDFEKYFKGYIEEKGGGCGGPLALLSVIAGAVFALVIFKIRSAWSSS